MLRIRKINCNYAEWWCRNLNQLIIKLLFEKVIRNRALKKNQFFLILYMNAALIVLEVSQPNIKEWLLYDISIAKADKYPRLIENSF